MVKLTPLAKILLTLIILGAAGSVAWHLGLKEKFASQWGRSGNSSTMASSSSSGSGATASGNGPLGSAERPLKVSIVSFHGYAPALVANGSSLKTKPDSIYGKKGLNVEFVIQDDIPTLTTIFEAQTAQCAWRTSDSWAQEQPNLRNAKHDGKAVVIVDNTQGGDAIITRDPAIKSVEDLAGHSVALLQFTPSDGMLTDAIENSSLTARRKSEIKPVYINAEEGTAGVRAAFESGKVDAAVLWDPDLSLALKAVPGAHVVYSTKTATNLIYDVMVCDARALKDPANEAVFQKFVEGWMEGVVAARANPDAAVDALVDNEEFFTLLAKKEGKPFIKGLFGNLVWTGLEDNARILGLSGGTNHYERVYARFDQIYRKAGALANPNSPVIAPQESFDYRFIKAMLAKNEQAKTAAAKPQYTFSESGQAAAASQKATVTKPVTVGFTSGSAQLTKLAERTIDKEVVPFLENNGSAYFEISGNTDSVGATETNLRLSRTRAAAVVDYLVAQWEFPRERFKVVGNGSGKPLCDEGASDREGLSLDECRAMNRTTRVAVLQR